MSLQINGPFKWLCLIAAHKVNAEIILAVIVAICQYLSGDNSDKSNEQYLYMGFCHQFSPVVTSWGVTLPTAWLN